MAWIEQGFFDRMFSRGRLSLLGTPTGIIIHYPGVDEEITVEKVHKWHKRAASGIGTGCGYHIMIGNGGTTEDGKVYFGRPLKFRGAHARGANWRTVGISVIGDMMKHGPTPGQMTTLLSLLVNYCNMWNLDPEGTRRNAAGKKGPVISGHRDWGKTDCPGDYLYEMLPNIRSAVSIMLEDQPFVSMGVAGAHG